MILDKNDIELTNGSIIDLHQTVNGENIFIVLDVKELDVRYRRDISYKYEYDTKELFAPGKFFLKKLNVCFMLALNHLMNWLKVILQKRYFDYGTTKTMVVYIKLEKF